MAAWAGSDLGQLWFCGKWQHNAGSDVGPPLPALSPLLHCRSSHSPCCHGHVICFSVYAGPGVHFGEAPPPAGAPNQSMLWVDTWLDGEEGRQEEAAAIVETFRPFWESQQHKKVRGVGEAGGRRIGLIAGPPDPCEAVLREHVK